MFNFLSAIHSKFFIFLRLQCPDSSLVTSSAAIGDREGIKIQELPLHRLFVDLQPQNDYFPIYKNYIFELKKIYKEIKVEREQREGAVNSPDLTSFSLKRPLAPSGLRTKRGPRQAPPLTSFGLWDKSWQFQGQSFGLVILKREIVGEDRRSRGRGREDRRKTELLSFSLALVLSCVEEKSWERERQTYGYVLLHMFRKKNLPSVSF